MAEQPVKVGSFLTKAALDVCVDDKWLTWLYLVRKEEGSLDRCCSFLLPRDAKVHEVKKLLSEQYGCQQQQIKLSDGLNNCPVLHGPIFHESSATERKLNLIITALDDRLEALYRMVSLSSVEERDRIMHFSLRARRPRQCPYDHDLDTEINEENERSFASLNLCCARCSTAHSPGYTIRIGDRFLAWFACSSCAECTFALCHRCLENDEGRPAVAPEDCHQALRDMAVALAFKRAEIACWFGGKGHLCGIPSVKWYHELGPKAYQVDDIRRNLPRDHPANVHQSTLILHPGACLRVVLSEDLQSVLSPEERDEIQVDQVREKGATCDDIIDLRNSLSQWSRSPLDVFSKINAFYQNRFPFYKTRCGDQSEAYITCKLISFHEEGAVFRVDASIDDGDY